MRRFLTFLLAYGLFLSSAVAQQAYDPGGRAKVSNYGKSTYPGDTALKLNSDGSLATGAADPTTATMQSAAVANGNGTVLTVTGESSAVLTVNCATCSGGTTINFEGTQDGTNYTALLAVQVGTSVVATSTTAAGVTVWQIPVAGLTSIRARISTWSAGTVTITGSAVPVDWNSRIFNAGNTRMATYMVDAIGYTAYATPTDMIGICGSATKTVVISNLSIRMNSTAAAIQGIYFIKRSTADTGGTATNPTGIAYDTPDAAPTAVVSVYTAAPAGLGTAIGTLRVVQVPSTVVTAAGGTAALNSNSFVVANSQTAYQPITLRGAAECLYMNYNGAALTTGFTAGYSIEWEEYAN